MHTPTAGLSNRAEEHLVAYPPDRLKLGKYYHKELNPDGQIMMSIAENSLMSKELVEYMESHFHITPTHLKYRAHLVNGFVPYASKALPQYFNNYFNPRRPVLPKHIQAGNGLGSLLAQVVWAVCDEGEGVLLPTPFYGDYPRDIVYPARAVPVAGHIPAHVDPLSTESISYLRSSIIRSNEEGTKIKMLLFCNPHNPLAQAYPKESIIQYAQLAEEFDLHFLVDEVYALQIFPTSHVPNPEPFVSVLSIDFQEHGVNPARIHILAGPTKDFGASGLKVGALISQDNPGLLVMIKESIRANPMSSASDAIFTQIIEDRKFCDWFLEENRRRLRHAYELAAGWAAFHKLTFLPGNAGVFFIVDFAPLIELIAPKDLAMDDKLMYVVEAMLKNGVFMRPTDNSADPIFTRFRMTFTLPEDVLLLGLARIEKSFGLPAWAAPPAATAAL
ncbi:PLP-dependent transferase [Athelia psychrophila]|uniref:PLP-dependent transferase n=1 Tax=Athelia psychrophila TaxID=1759441 RepID=A0A165WQ07_9AGAM|nr:PLP-dependent transferase [Fibularhizoctonia sp. CBS 109695]